MKIIHITDHVGSGGVNSFVYDLCCAQIGQGMDVSFVGIMDSGINVAKSEIENLKACGVRVVCLGAPNKKDAVLKYTGKLRKVIQGISGEEDCVCNLHLKLSVLLGIAATIGLKNIKCIETYHNTYHHYELQYGLCYPFIKHYIAISQTCGAEMKRRFHTPDWKMSIIPNGIDREKIRELSKGDTITSHDEIRIISVGRLSREKNFIKPIEALSEMCNENLRYCIIGNGPQYSEAITASKGNKYIEFMGWLPRKDTLHNLADADIVIMPSLWEGRSILQLEAMALDKPLILSDVPALREVFEESALYDRKLFRECSWGYLVRTNDANAYREAVIAYQLLPKSKIEEMKRIVMEKSKASDIMETALHYQKVYQIVINGNAANGSKIP